MRIKYQFYKNEGLLIQKFIGSLSIEYYIQYTRFVMEKYNAEKIDKVLNDFREMEIDEMADDFFDNVDKMTDIRKNIHNNEIKRNDINVVFWVDKPLPTVIAHLFIKNFRNINYYYCSTADNAFEILKINKDFGSLENAINNLENTF